MRYHYCEGDAGYCDCGRYVKAKALGFGPQTHFVYLDSDNNETCEV